MIALNVKYWKTMIKENELIICMLNTFAAPIKMVLDNWVYDDSSLVSKRGRDILNKKQKKD